MNVLIPNVIRWAEERNIVKGSTLEKETLKLISELGELTKFIDHVDICRNGIGHSLICMIIICRMKNVTLDQCLEFTKNITDERITEPRVALIMIMKYAGKIAERIYTKKEFKAEMGYLLIYLTAFSNSFQLSMRDCLACAFQDIKEDKSIMFDGGLIDDTDARYETAKAIIKSRNLIA